MYIGDRLKIRDIVEIMLVLDNYWLHNVPEKKFSDFSHSNKNCRTAASVVRQVDTRACYYSEFKKRCDWKTILSDHYL